MNRAVQISVLFLICCAPAIAQHKVINYLDLQPTSKGAVQTKLSNYGILGFDPMTSKSATFWPRGSANSYLFGGGFWFGALKRNSAKSLRKMSVTAFDANTAQSVFEPTLNYACSTRKDSLRCARNYISTDFNADGNPVASTDSIGYDRWPVKATASADAFGEFVADPLQRGGSTGKAVMLSDEDFVARMNDANLSLYPDGKTISKSLGYPLGLDVVQKTYFFQSGPLKDVMFVRYEIEHHGADTLFRCWFAPVLDCDLGRSSVLASLSNDVERYYAEEPELNLGTVWTKVGGSYESDLGYLGACFLQTPAVNSMGFIDHTATADKELGLRTYQSWRITNDPASDVSRYDFMSADTKASPGSPGDVRYIMSSGAFNLLPHEKVVISYALLFAKPSAGADATGTTEDLKDLVDLCRKTHTAYNNMRYKGSFVSVETQGADNILALQETGTAGCYRLGIASSDEPVRCTLYSVLGQRCMQQEVVAGEVVDFRALAKGCYLAQIEVGGALQNQTILLH